MEAIKRVYASTFSQHAKAYVRATPYRLEEEKMAVVVQQVVGRRTATASIPIFPASCARATSIRIRPCGGGRLRRRRPGTWPRSGGRGKMPDFQSALPAESGAVFVSGGHAGKLADRILGARLGPRGPQRRPAADLREVPFRLDAAEADGTLQCSPPPIGGQSRRV